MTLIYPFSLACPPHVLRNVLPYCCSSRLKSASKAFCRKEKALPARPGLVDSLPLTFPKSTLKDRASNNEQGEVLNVGTQRQTWWKSNWGIGTDEVMFVRGFQLDLKRMEWLIVQYILACTSIMQNLPFCPPYTASHYMSMLYQPYMPFLPFCPPLDNRPSNYAFPSSFYVQPEVDWPEQPAPPLWITESQTHPLPPPSPALTPQKAKVKRRGGRRGSADQKQNRNVYSNILRNFFRKVNDSSRIERLVRQIINRNELPITPADFHEHVRRLKVNHGKYLRFKKLRALFLDCLNPHHAAVFRCLFEHMVAGELLTQTLTSRKIGRWSVLLHLRGARELKERLYH